MPKIMITEEKKAAFLTPDVIMALLEGKCQHLLSQNDVQLVTSDFAFYEAISSMTKEEVKHSVLSDFFLKVQFVSSPKIIITMDRIKHLRKIAKLKNYNLEES